jgi:hypothetical protein
MNGSNFMQGWVVLTGSVAMIALILTAFGLMLGIVRPADALKRIGTILGIVMVLLLIRGIIANAWSGLSLWQRLGVTMIGTSALLVLQPRRQPKNRH